MRQLFRQAVKALATRLIPAPKKSARRRSDERGRQFRRLAKRIVQRYATHSDVRSWLADTLDWLELWQPSASDDLSGDAESAPNNHLSPRL
jgi:hypothetical protein